MFRSAPKPELPSVFHAAKYPQIATDPPFQFPTNATLGPEPERIPPLHVKPEFVSVLGKRTLQTVHVPTLGKYGKVNHNGFFMFCGFLILLIIIFLFYYIKYHPGDKDRTFW